jgi:hypothetical protein
LEGTSKSRRAGKIPVAWAVIEEKAANNRWRGLRACKDFVHVVQSSKPQAEGVSGAAPYFPSGRACPGRAHL